MPLGKRRYGRRGGPCGKKTLQWSWHSDTCRANSSLKPFGAEPRKSAPRAATTINTDAPANLNAGIGGSDPNEARAILRARIATGAQMLCSRLWRFFARLINRLSRRAPSWKYCKNDYKDDFSHKSFYRVARAIPTDNAANVCLRQRCGSECVLDAIVHMRDQTLPMAMRIGLR
jgi:hypothetical protein